MKNIGCGIIVLGAIILMLGLSQFIHQKYVLNVIILLIVIGILPSAVCMLNGVTMDRDEK